MRKNENRLLLISNSQMHGRGFFEHARDEICDSLEQAGTKKVLFVPYALADHYGYTEIVRQSLAMRSIEVIGIHDCESPTSAVRKTDAILVGGGNTFRLAKTLLDLALLGVIEKRVASGDLLYIGSSAGTVIACPTIRTTNDMPIKWPWTDEALGLLPFQINPHYLDHDPRSTYMGEPRELRIEQFLEENDVPVLGLREGSWLKRQGASLVLGGLTPARLFMRGAAPKEYQPGDDLSFLLGVMPRIFDTSR